MIEFLGSGRRFNIRVVYSIEEKPLGTGGALRNAEEILRDELFIALNGDIITNIDLSKLVNSLNKDSKAIISMALVPLKSPYGIIELSNNGYVKAFNEKPLLKNYLINAGIYVMKPEIFAYVPKEGDLEKTTFPELASKLMVKGVVYEDIFWRSIDTVKDVQEASKEVKIIFHN